MIMLVTYHQFSIAAMGSSPVVDSAEVNRPARQVTKQDLWGLDAEDVQPLVTVGTDGQSIIVFTGIAMGPVLVTLLTDVGAPPSTDGLWEESQEIVVPISEERYFFAPTAELLEPVRVPAPTRPGPHRVTVYARGRTLRWDQTLEHNDDPAEEYVIVLQPEPR